MPMIFKKLPPFAVVSGMFTYNPDDGEFYWRVNLFHARWPVKIGDKVASKPRGARGHRMITVRGHGQFFAHRLAWLMYHGVDPEGEIDHRDGDGGNNRIANLRPATSSQQKQNKCVQSNNRSGLKGAYFHACRKGLKWRSQIKVDGKLIFLGYFETAEQAHVAYSLAEAKYFGEFARAA